MLRRFRPKDNSVPQLQSLVSDDAVDTVEPLSLTVLDGPSKAVDRLSFIPGADLILLECSDSENFVFEIDSAAFRRDSFADGYVSGNCGAVPIWDDIVASVHSSIGKIITWCASTNHIHSTLLTALKRREALIPRRSLKLTEEQFLVTHTNGQCFVIEHLRGHELRLVHEFDIEDVTNLNAYVFDMVVHGNFLFILTSYFLKVHDINSSFEKLHEIAVFGAMRTIAVSAKRICVGSSIGKLHVYLNTSGFPLDFVLDGRVEGIKSILILSDDLIACVGFNGRISFVSISGKKVLYIMHMPEIDGSRPTLLSAVVLGDGRIAVGGDLGFCATFHLPPPLRDVFQECAARLYPWSVAGTRLYPFRSSWLQSQHSNVSSKDACRKMSSIENGPSSLDEWAFGHNLLMKAVHEGAVPASTDFDGKQYHWLRVLYKYCPELAMGEYDLSMVLSMLREARQAGVINEVETIVHSIETRRHTMDRIVEGQRLMFNAVYELFMHQAEQDAVLQELLQWKRVQQLTGLVNALLACVPFCGALVTNAVAATATVLNDINLHDLVDALLGVGKDTGGGLVTDKMVGLFVKRSNVLLSEEEWEKIPERQRKYVEAAAKALGMSIEVLRRQLLKAASNEIMDDNHSVPDTDMIVEDVEKNGGSKKESIVPSKESNQEKRVVFNDIEDYECYVQGKSAEFGNKFDDDDLNDVPNKKDSSDSSQAPLSLLVEGTPPETFQIPTRVDGLLDPGEICVTNEEICNQQLRLAVMPLNEEVEKMREEYAWKEERMIRRIGKLEENEKATQTLVSNLITEIGKLKKELSELKEQQMD